MSRFNPPPGWPVPQGWEPGPDWSPDPEWVPAPPGWTFWIDDAASLQGGAPRRLSRRWTFLAVSVAVGVVVVLVVVFVLPTPRTQPTAIRTLPEVHTIAPEGAIRPDWPSWHSIYVDFRTWAPFGGVDARFADNGRSVVLDTHDTVDTWQTKWSGLIDQGTPMCEFRINGKVRSVSHRAGVPGGFAIGLTALGAGEPTPAVLTGTGVQFDFGFNGFRVARYPDDSGQSVAVGPLDNEWHRIEVAIGPAAHTLIVDGMPALQTPGSGQCGTPTLRVWAGAAEFADFSFQPV